MLNHKILALTIVVMLSLSMTVHSKITIGTGVPTYRVLGDNHLQINMAQVFDLTFVKPGAKFTFESQAAAGAGKILDYTTAKWKANLQSAFDSVSFISVLNQNSYFIAQSGSSEVTKLLCAEKIDGDEQLDCVSTGFDPSGTPQGVTWVTQDSVYESEKKAYFVVWLSDKGDKLLIKSFSTIDNAEIGSLMVDLTDTPIKNRARLLVVKTDAPNPQTPAAFDILVFDQRTRLAADVPIAPKVLWFSIDKDNKIVVPEGADAPIFLTFTDEKTVFVADSLNSFYEHDDVIYATGTLTPAATNDDPNLGIVRLVLDKTQKKLMATASIFDSGVKAGFLGFHGNNIFQYELAKNQVTKFSFTWKPEDVKPSVEAEDQVIIDQGIWKGDAKAVRRITGANSSFAVNLVTATGFTDGVNDSGENTLILSSYLNAQFKGKANSVNININSFQVQVEAQAVNYYLLQHPYYFVDTDALDTGVIDVKFTATDEETTPTIDATGTWQKVARNALFNKIEVSAYKHPIAEVYPGGVNYFSMPYSQIVLGNDLRFSMVWKGTKDTDKFNTMTLLSKTHHVNFGEEFAQYEISAIKYMTGAVLIQDEKSKSFIWYQCSEENDVTTQCIKKIQVPRYGMDIQSKFDGILQAIYTTSYQQKTASGGDYTFFQWYEIGGDWQYEHYQGLVHDVTHVKNSVNEIHMVMVFNDYITISKFFDNWSFGNRGPVKFEKDDLNLEAFCPKKVIVAHRNIGSFYILSDCVIGGQQTKRVQTLVKFSIFKIPVFISSRELANTATTPEICIMNDEIVIFEALNEKNQLRSVDRYFTETSIKTDLKDFGIDRVVDFVCYPERNEFYVLNEKLNKDPKLITTEIVIFRGGQHKDVLNRIKTRVLGLPADISSVQPFVHQGDVIFALINNQNKVTYKRYYDDKPVIQLNSDPFQPTDTTLTYSVLIKNTGKGSAEAKGNIRLLKPLGMPAPVMRKTQDLALNSVYSVNYLYDLTKTPISGAVVSADATDYFQIRSGDNSKIEFDQGNNVVGKFLQIGDEYTLIASYSKSSRLQYGRIQIFDQSPTPKLLSSFYSDHAFRSVSAVQKAKYTYFALLNNEQSYSSLQFTLAKDGKFSTKTFQLTSVTDFSSVDILLTDSKQIDQTTTVLLTLLGYSKGDAQITVYTIKVTLPVGEDINTWTAVNDGNIASSDPGIGVNSVVDQIADGKTVNIYYKSTKDNTAQAYLISYDKQARTFTAASPLVFEPADPTPKDSEIAGIGCERFKMDPTKGDKCAFSTYGSVVYSATITVAEGQAPVVAAKRLRRFGNYFGTKVSLVNERFVMLETQTFKPADYRKLLIWDIGDYSKQSLEQTATDLPVYQVLELRNNDKEKSGDSKFLGAKVIETAFMNFEVNLYIQNEYSNEKTNTYNVKVNTKTLTPWLLKCIKVPETEEAFNKMKITFNGYNNASVDVLIKDVLTYKPPAADFEEVEQRFNL